MTRKTTETIDCLVDEWRALEQLLRPLTKGDLERPTRCDGLTVHGVAAHAVAIVTDIVEGTTGAMTAEQEADARTGRSGAELADEIATSAPKAAELLRALPETMWDGPSPLDGMSIRQAVDAGVVEAVVHNDDIRLALGRETTVATPALTIVLEHIADRLEARGWAPRTLTFPGLPEIAVRGGGDRVAGDPWAFVLAATGRVAPESLGLDASVNIFA